jgi:hypothetical protein
MKNIIFIALFIFLLISSCETKKKLPEPILPAPQENGKYSNGCFIINEGNYLAGNAEISFLSFNNYQIFQDIFKEETKKNLGDVAQSAILHDTLLLVCVNNSGKIEMVGRKNFTHVATLSDGLLEPRYMTVHQHKLYVSDWGINGIRVFDLTHFKAITTLTTNDHPEQLLTVGSEIWVANTGGCFRPDDSTVSIIKTTDNTVKSLKVGENPTQIATHKDGTIIVLCIGKRQQPTCQRISEPELVAISPQTQTILWRKKLGNKGFSQMILSDENYYLNGTDGIYRWNGSGDFPSTPYIKGNFYGFNVQPITQQVYGLDAIDFTQRGWLKRYQNNGIPIDSFRVGMIPNSTVFNP